MTSDANIAILGAGPAAIATACALRRLGHDVLLIGRPGNRAVEGISERTLALMRQQGLMTAASASAREPGERTGIWADAELARGREYVVDRTELDRALLADAVVNGVATCKARSLGYERLGPLWRVRTDQGEVLCRVIVDARGRRGQRSLHRGPELLAVCQRYRARHAQRVLTRLEPVPQGWCWLASSGDTNWLQVTSSPKERSLRSGLEEHLRAFLDAAPEIAATLRGATPQGAPLARAATAALSACACVPGAFRAGDALLALDPLSGQGVYEALSSAHVTAAAVHTYLATGEWEPIQRFIAERLQELWERRNATAALHYERQAQITPSAFWRWTAARCRSTRPARNADPKGARIEWRPVLNGSLIQVRRVIVTPQAPRGVWQLEAVDLPELMDLLGSAPMDVERAAHCISRPPAAVAHAMQWLSSHGLSGRVPKPARQSSADFEMTGRSG